jgi:hypothetical protein
MTRKNYIVLFVLGVTVIGWVASLQSQPGYLDSDYYFASGLQLVEGKGFTEPFLWNYLDDPQGIPHPSHTYWYPLSSLLSALSMFVTGAHTYAGARLIFILISGLVPVVTAALAFKITGKKTLAWVSGLLAVFSVYHVPFLSVTDNFGPFMLLGGLYFFFMLREEKYFLFLLGILAGLFNLARSDGLLWLGMTGLLALWRARVSKTPFKDFLVLGTLAFTGYLLIMVPWYVRNYSVFGSIMAPGGDRILWLTNYNDTFAFPASRVNMEAWLQTGWNEALKTRLWALRLNLMNTLGAQGGILLFPFILLGLWQVKDQTQMRLAVTGWGILLFVMTLFFPFAGARGGFFHAGAAFQPFWWSVAPLGLDRLTDWIRRRDWLDDRAYTVFRGALIGICVLLTGTIVWLRILKTGWQTESQPYLAIEQVLLAQDAQHDELIIVRNPVSYYIQTGRSAIVLPTGGVEAVLALAQHYEVSYFALEPGGVLEEYQTLYDNSENHSSIIFIGEIEGAKVYELHPTR